MMRRIVVLPEPFGPTSPTRDRGGIPQSTPLRTSCTPNDRLTPPRRSIARVYTAGAARFNGGGPPDPWENRRPMRRPTRLPVRRHSPAANRSARTTAARSPRSLDLAPAEIARLERLVSGILSRWNASRSEARILPAPGRVPALAPVFRTPLPWHPEPEARLRADLDALLELARRNDSPRFWGYVAPPAIAWGVVADWLASGINQNLTAFRSSPGAALLELQVTGWIREMVGLPRGASGLLVSGGSVANL